ncbi:MAG: hypothetical protein ABW137_02015 [Mycobacterium sp.]
MRRPAAFLAVLIAVLTAALTIVGCGPLKPENPMESSLPIVYGARITDGKLNIWTGSPCAGTTSVRIAFESSDGKRAEMQLGTPTYEGKLTPGVQVDHLVIGDPNPGFDVLEALPQGFDWLGAQTLTFDLGGPDLSPGRVTQIDLAEVKSGSAQHPADTYWFSGIGWLDPEQLAAQDGKTLLAYCTPDPARESLPRVSGVRVTDGTLRIWTGSPCSLVTGVMLTFQPGQADLVLNSEREIGQTVEFLTVGGPYPGFAVANALPRDFDWRTEKSVLLRVRFDGVWWTKTTDLAAPIAESATHPADTYYFEGFGWLSPAQVAAGDGKEFITACSEAPK